MENKHVHQNPKTAPVKLNLFNMYQNSFYHDHFYALCNFLLFLFIINVLLNGFVTPSALQANCTAILWWLLIMCSLSIVSYRKIRMLKRGQGWAERIRLQTTGGRGSSVGRARGSWWGGPGSIPAVAARSLLVGSVSL